MTSCADHSRFAGSHRTIARARTASPAALSTRPIGRPSTAVDAEGHGLGAVLLISRGRPCGCGTKGKGWHRCGTAPPDGADAERQQPWPALRITPRRPYERETVGLADQNADHWRKPLLTQNGSGWPIGIVITDARCYERRSGSLADTAADRRRPPILVRISISGRSADWHKYACTIVRLYYYAAMRIQRYRHIIICAYAHKRIKR
jgi:hypothetical protein